MIKHTNILNMADFHAYVDSQLSDMQYEDIEKRLIESPDTITNLQNCLLINERLQACFQGPDLELSDNDESGEKINPYTSSDSWEYIPPEPRLEAILNKSLESPDESTLDSLTNFESLDLYEEDDEIQAPVINTILPAREQEISLPVEEESEFDLPEIAMQRNEPPPPKVRKLLRKKQEVTQEKSSIPPLLTNPNFSTAPATPTTTSSNDQIDVDDFLKGINETHMVDRKMPYQRAASGNAQDGISSDLFPATMPFAATPSIFDRIKVSIAQLFNTMTARSRSRAMQNERRANESDANIEDFEIDINEAMNSTPKLRFWRFRMQHAADDAIDSVKEQLEPIAPTVSPWLRSLKMVSAQVNTRLRKNSVINKTMNRSYWILGGLFAGLFLGIGMFGSNVGLNNDDLESLAIDSHLYFLDQGKNVAEGGNDDFEKNMLWLQKRWGTKVKEFDITENSKFRKKGATLLPTLNDYASLQIFENYNEERITLYVSQAIDDSITNSRIRCHIPNKVDGLCSWVKDSLSYIAVGNLSLSRIRLFSTLIVAES